MSSYQTRQKKLIYTIACKAQKHPTLGGGLWFHHDIRDNFYYASYLFAAAVDPAMQLPFDKEMAAAKASQVLLAVIRLQNQDPNSDMYGHWPLRLDPVPQKAPLDLLPIELMGSLMAVFCRHYKHLLSKPLQTAFEEALKHVYRSRFYAKENRFSHHDAKYTAAKLIFGDMFKDEELLADGHRSLLDTLDHLRENGMSEYGGLPWFWHWVQAFTAAWELVEDADINWDLSEMLDYLWEERARYYLKGTWVGPHSRARAHDVPRDANVLFDYVQFGDFPLPEKLPRTEYAAFLFYEAAPEVRETAVGRREPVVEKRISVLNAGSPDRQTVHRYVYITERFAAGGIWERVEEFANEQHRWDVTFPLTGSDSVNQAYFFHLDPSAAAGSGRGQSGIGEVLFHRNTIISLYPIPEGADDRVIGILPKGEWLQRPQALFGRVEGVYLAVFLHQGYKLEEQEDRCVVVSEGLRNGVVVEAVSESEAGEDGVEGLEAFAEKMSGQPPVFEATADGMKASYRGDRGRDLLELTVGAGGLSQAAVNGETIAFDDYTV